MCKTEAFLSSANPGLQEEGQEPRAKGTAGERSLHGEELKSSLHREELKSSLYREELKSALYREGLQRCPTPESFLLLLWSVGCIWNQPTYVVPTAAVGLM